MTVSIIVGAQYGSEGKGVITSALARHTDPSANVRVGGPNAGHSHQAFNQRWAQRMLPVGWAHGSSEAALILGRGAVVDPVLLEHEIMQAQEYDASVSSRTFVDGHATWLKEKHHDLEGGIDGHIHKAIGSTGEGVGLARQERLMRTEKMRSLIKHRDIPSLFIQADTVDMLHDMRSDNQHILVEGTQGSGLSLIHGPWPYVTTADTNAAGIMADAGLAPGPDINVGLVCRAYPIRVAGNSGPMCSEITWDEISARVGDIIQERTTVTKLVRRVSEWDQQLFIRACKLNRPNWIALTFADYIDPKVAGEDEWHYVMRSREVAQFVNMIEATAGCPVRAIGTGGDNWSVAWRF